MTETTTQRKDGFGVLGIGAAACIACCAPLILAFLGGLGLAATFWFGAAGLVVAALAVGGFLMFRHRRQPATEGATCSADGSCGCR
jgi:hypothetical protein